MGRLQQGKRPAAEYFLRFEQLVVVAGIDINWYPNTLQYVERNVQHVLIDQLYQSDSPPETYQDYKKWITMMDEMRRRRETWKGGTREAPRTMIRSKEPDAMEVDLTAKRKEERKCFACSEAGHLARECPSCAQKQGF
jgi:hypothetical protein